MKSIREGKRKAAIIFVHGVLSDGNQAWGKPSWPTLVKEDPLFDEWGVHVFTYRTTVLSGNYSISDAADALREELRSERLLDVNQLVFVCHSMGGLVVRRFLVANQLKLQKRQINLGLFLVASPSLGSRDANYLSLLSYAFQHVQGSSLKFSQSNTFINDLHADFQALLSSGILDIVGRELIEDQPLKFRRWWLGKRQIVEPFSAAQYFNAPGFEPLKIPGSDHLSIAKPRTDNAAQHRALRNFQNLFSQMVLKRNHLIADAAKEPKPHTKSENMGIEYIARDNLLDSTLSEENAAAVKRLNNRTSAIETLETALALRTDGLLGRALSSTVVRELGKPLDVFMALGDRDSSRRDVEAVSAWLRFVPQNSTSNEKLYEILGRVNENSIEIDRLKITIAGWFGSTYFPDIAMNDHYQKEKFSPYYLDGYCHTLWRRQSVHQISNIISQMMRSKDIYHDRFSSLPHLFDFMGIFRGVHPANWHEFLDRVLFAQPEADMVEAALSVFCMRPLADISSRLASIIEGENARLSNQACSALAYSPAGSERLRDLKSRLFRNQTDARLIAAGTDQDSDELPFAEQVLSDDNGSPPAFSAAWLLCRTFDNSDDAKNMLDRFSVEHANQLVRSICLVGLSSVDAETARARTDQEWETSRGTAKFCLAIARMEQGSPTHFVQMLRDTNDGEFHVPIMLPLFQSLANDVIGRASIANPILSVIHGFPTEA